jgi:hypothetical protein
MSTVARVNFEPVSDILATQRRDFPLADPTLADPNSATPLVDGEWMILDANSQLVRAADVATPDTLATQTSYPLWAERGRYDVQALANRKMPIIWLGDFEFDTRIFDASAALGGGAAITTVGQPLKVATITIGTRNFVGLVGAVAGDGEPVVGRVTRLPANNGGRLRFRSASSI